MQHLAELEIRSYRNLLPTKLRFRPGINVLLGKNASGKTTFLRLLTQLLDGSGLADLLEPFDLSRLSKDAHGTLFHSSRGTPKAQSGVLLAGGLPGGPPTGLSLVEDYVLQSGALSAKVTVAGGRVKDNTGRTTQHSSEGLFALLKHLLEPEADASVEAAPAADPDLDPDLDFNAANRAIALAIFRLEATPTLRLDESLDYFKALLAFEATRLAGTTPYPGPPLLPSGDNAPRAFSDLPQFALGNTAGARASVSPDPDQLTRTPPPGSPVPPVRKWFDANQETRIDFNAAE